VIYRRDGIQFRASWSTGGETATLEQEHDGEWVPAEGSVATRLPAQILGQGEMHKTARQPRALVRRSRRRSRQPPIARQGLADKLAREDDTEAVLTQPDRSSSAR
jgi:hypothetical protein